MKKVIAIVMAVVILVSLTPVTALAGVGNNSPTGQHVTLNIIGVDKEKNNDMLYSEDDPSNRSTIFVKLDGTTRIYLKPGGDIDDLANDWRDAFGVIDANGTDGVAKIQIANPDYLPYVIGETPVDATCDYKIVARPLGKPNGFATITTCAELEDETGAALVSLLSRTEQKEIMNIIDEVTGAYCSVQPVPAEFTFRHAGQEKFENVTAYLTSIVFQIWIDVDGDSEGGVIGEEDPNDAYYYIRVPIFDPLLENEYWKYDNEGLKLLQVRFYPGDTDVTYADGELPSLPQN